MAKYRNSLPQLSGKLFLTDSGLETTLIFHHGLDLPCFAAFTLLKDAAGTKILRDYYRQHAAIALASGAGFILESPTWRTSADWGAKLGYSEAGLADANRRAIELLSELRGEMETSASPMVISGNLGPRGDGYNPDRLMSAAEAEAYHSNQIATFRDTAADMVLAATMSYVDEAVGIARAAVAAGIPSAIAFTVETDGRLRTGQTLKEAIEAVDDLTGHAPAYFMINCAHPTHFERELETREPWVKRLRGLRANASKRGHAELDNSTDLDDGNPVELGQQYGALVSRFPQLTVLGGCCGTDHRHVEAISRSCTLHDHAAHAA